MVYIALLRGVNISGKNLLKMAELKILFMEMGYADAETYIQSGNVVFTAEEQATEVLGQRITTAIQERFDMQVPVLILTLTEMEKVLSSNPYLKDERFEVQRLYFIFMLQIPSAASVEELKSKHIGPDTFEWNERMIYLHCPSGYGNTKLNNNHFEKKLKVQATTRNLNTVLELIRMGNKKIG